jgi:hypothetical protein
MGTYLHWKKGVFKSTYEILSGEMFIGNLRPDSWSNDGKGELNGKKYIFVTKGFFNQETMIINPNTNLRAGKITYNTWKTKATIEYDGKVFFWKYDNGWNTKWSITDSATLLVRYHGSFTKGEIEISSYDELLILTGLYITNYFWQISSIVTFTAFLPVFITIFN